MFYMSVDGVENPIDITNLTAREIGTCKRVAHIGGYNDIVPALNARDMELYCALAGISIERAGAGPVNYEALLDMPHGMITIVRKKEESEDGTEAPLDTTAESPENTGTPD